jgi:peptidoglycan/LPS O-acetylase OafA/YrhL
MSSNLNGKTLRGSESRFEAIDGLRALAVLSVIAFHFGIDIAHSGFIGVDMFFAISGYVITLSLTQNTGKSIFQYIAEFYKRRILRIMPALVFCLVIVGFFSQLFVPISWLSSSNNTTGFYAFFGLSNFALTSGFDGYFNVRAEFNPFLHTWSLAIEEQFYLFFPLLLLPWLRGHAGSRIKTYLYRNIVLIVGLISLLWSAIESSRDPQLAFYMLPSRFWELAAGALLLQYHSAGRCIPRSIIGVRIITSIGITLIVFGMISANAEVFPFPWALAPIGGTLMLISAARSPDASKSLAISLLKNPLVVYVGRSSYSLYLWHWPVVVLMRWTIGFDTASQLGFAFILTLILGFSSYNLIEKPFLRSKPLRLFPAWQIVPTGLALTVGFAVVFNMVMESPIHLSITTNEKGWHPGDLPNNLSSTSVISGKSASTIWVIGDSHAGAYRGMIREAAANVGMKFKIKGLSGCSVASLRVPYPDTNYCEHRLNRLFEELASNYSEGDIVLLASLRGQRLSDQWGMYEPERLDRILNEKRRAQYRKALGQSREIVERLLSIGYIVIIDTPKPVFRAPLFRCSDWFNHMNPVCAPGFEVPAAELRDLDAPVLESLHTLKTEFPDLIVWDPFPILCPDNVCLAFRDGKPLFFDQDHLSGYGNQLLLPSFSKLLLRINQT